MAARDVELRDPPHDGISAARFSPYNQPLLLACSWDSRVRLYDVMSNSLRCTYEHRGAVLDACFSPSTYVYSGGLDKTIKQYDIAGGGGERFVGAHDKAVRCVEFSAEHDFLVTGSWDATLRLWDPRSHSPAVGTYPQPDKVYTMALSGNRIIVGTAGRRVNIYDMRRMDEPEQQRESSLKYQTRCIRAFPDGSGYVLSSIEGRVAVEYFDPAAEVQAQKYAFKCHRTLVNGIDTVYPVNAIAFHPGFGSFATGGCDGVVNIWDGANKKRLSQLSRYPTSIAYLSFSNDGSMLAVSSSYTFEEGERDHPPDSIFIHRVAEGEVRPKPRAQAPLQ
jgi:cell cycle arrest protein BUB3